MSARPEKDQSARDEAAAWTIVVESGEMSETQRGDFHAWCGEPRNARALSETRALLAMIQDLPDHKAASLRRMPIHHERFPVLSELFSNPLRVSAVATAVVAILVVGAWLGFRPVREYFSETYATQTGESRTVILKDGTIAHLNTNSRMRWTGVGNDRRVSLELGEVLFQVAHDASRPFKVTVGSSEIRDLATEFDVYRKANGSVVVTVLKGQVAVKDLGIGDAPPAWAERDLKPDEQIEYTPASLIADIHPVDAAKSVRWREGLLETEGQSFSTVISELNRYTNKQISIPDPRVDAAHIEIGGALGIHDVPGALFLIQEIAPVVITDNGDSYVLTYKTESAAKEQTTAPQQNAVGRP
jgi:transmembrane sensor